MQGFNRKNKFKIKYPSVPSVTRPIVSLNLSNDSNSQNSSMVENNDRGNTDSQIGNSMEVDNDEEEETEEFGFVSESSDSEDSDGDSASSKKSKSPKLLDQQSLNDFVRRIGVAKDMAEYIAAEFKKRGFLEKGTKSSYYRDREKEFRKYYAESEDQLLVYCTDV